MTDLLTLTDIADMHHCKERHARDVIVNRATAAQISEES